MEQYASHMSAGLISDRGIAEYTKSLKSNSKYQTSLKSEKWKKRRTMNLLKSN